jgi:hypothetical protein
MNGENTKARNDKRLTNLLIIYPIEIYTQYAVQNAEPADNIGDIPIWP